LCRNSSPLRKWDMGPKRSFLLRYRQVFSSRVSVRIVAVEVVSFATAVRGSVIKSFHEVQ
jgi:hypothetical protein